MPVLTVGLSDDLLFFIEGMVRLGQHPSPDGVIVAALERYQHDIVSEFCLAARIDTGQADMKTLQAFLELHDAAHPTLPVPITEELKARIEILIGPIADIDIDLEKSIESDGK